MIFLSRMAHSRKTLFVLALLIWRQMNLSFLQHKMMQQLNEKLLKANREAEAGKACGSVSHGSSLGRDHGKHVVRPARQASPLGHRPPSREDPGQEQARCPVQRP